MEKYNGSARYNMSEKSLLPECHFSMWDIAELVSTPITVSSKAFGRTSRILTPEWRIRAQENARIDARARAARVDARAAWERRVKA